ncbi:tyrosine-type recombinase/integrase [Marinomonas sp.]|uniref:tyrosine-type recombinase/integrase n=1 Tax=Marinomonas sp. TaxID=1904862 RepID=UPI003A8CB996
MPLTDRELKTLKPKEKPYKLADEKGLYIEVTPSGSKLWRMKYRFEGKEKRLSIGPYPDVSLKTARLKRDEARSNLASGIDPSAKKQAEKFSNSSTNTFEAVAREWHSIKQAKNSEKHQQTVLRRLERMIFPKIGNRQIDTIKPIDVLELLRKLEDDSLLETAHKVRGYISSIFQFAIQTGRAENNPASDLKGAMRTAKPTHRAALTTPKDVGALMLAIDHYAMSPAVTPVVVAALKCSALWFCRQKEIRFLEWEQVHWDKAQIETKAAKTNADFVIPLAKQAIEVLKELHKTTGQGKYVFPSARGDSRTLSENGVNVAIRTMGFGKDKMCAHGFRSMGRTLLDEVLNYPPHIIEQQLAHVVRDPLGRAYNRTQHLEQRREMMQHWADYLDKLKHEAAQGNVISANFKQA